jgi:hypothetical protein
MFSFSVDVMVTAATITTAADGADSTNGYCYHHCSSC